MAIESKTVFYNIKKSGGYRMDVTTQTPRLLAAAKEFNIGHDTLIKFLKSKGFVQKDFKPTTRLSEEMYEYLLSEFQQDRANKRKSAQISLPLNVADDGGKDILNKTK